MAKLNGEDVIEEFEDFSIRVEDGSPILDKCEYVINESIQVQNEHPIHANLFQQTVLPANCSPLLAVFVSLFYYLYFIFLLPVLDIGHMFGFAAEMLCNEWIAFASQNNSCQLEPDSLCLWEGHLHASSRNKSALAKGVVPRGSRSMEKFGVNVTATFSEKNLDDL